MVSLEQRELEWGDKILRGIHKVSAEDKDTRAQNGNIIDEKQSGTRLYQNRETFMKSVVVYYRHAVFGVIQMSSR